MRKSIWERRLLISTQEFDCILFADQLDACRLEREHLVRRRDTRPAVRPHRDVWKRGYDAVEKRPELAFVHLREDGDRHEPRRRCDARLSVRELARQRAGCA